MWLEPCVKGPGDTGFGLDETFGVCIVVKADVMCGSRRVEREVASATRIHAWFVVTATTLGRFVEKALQRIPLGKYALEHIAIGEEKVAGAMECTSLPLPSVLTFCVESMKWGRGGAS